MTERCEYDLHAFAPRNFHGWDDVGVAGNNYNTIDQSVLRHERNIEPNAQINTFLSKHGLKVVSDNLTSLGQNFRCCFVR